MNTVEVSETFAASVVCWCVDVLDLQPRVSTHLYFVRRSEAKDSQLQNRRSLCSCIENGESEFKRSLDRLMLSRPSTT